MQCVNILNSINHLDNNIIQLYAIDHETDVVVSDKHLPHNHLINNFISNNLQDEISDSETDEIEEADDYDNYSNNEGMIKQNEINNLKLEKYAEQYQKYLAEYSHYKKYNDNINNNNYQKYLDQYTNHLSDYDKYIFEYDLCLHENDLCSNEIAGDKQSKCSRDYDEDFKDVHYTPNNNLIEKDDNFTNQNSNKYIVKNTVRSTCSLEVYHEKIDIEYKQKPKSLVFDERIKLCDEKIKTVNKKIKFADRKIKNIIDSQ